MLKKALVTSVMLLAFGAHAEVTVSGVSEFAVTGKIVKAPCALTLTGAGKADFGTLSTAQVQNYVLAPSPPRYATDAAEKKIITLKVLCDGSSKIALEFLDNRGSSVSGPADTLHWGLGTYTKAGGTLSQNIGSYTINFVTNITLRPTATAVAQSPGQAMYVIGLPTDNAVWAAPIGNEGSFLPSGKTLGLSLTAGKFTPDTMTEIKMDLAFGLEILKEVLDDANSDIILNGSGTVTLVSL